MQKVTFRLMHALQHTAQSTSLWKVRYFVWVANLLCGRKITLRSARFALRTFPIAIAGRGGSYILDHPW